MNIDKLLLNQADRNFGSSDFSDWLNDNFNELKEEYQETLGQDEEFDEVTFEEWAERRFDTIGEE